MYRNFVTAAVVCTFLLVHVGSRAAPAAPISPSHPYTPAQVASFRAYVDRLAGLPPLTNAHIGVSIVQPASGRVLVARDADGEFAPASNFKLLDAATALAYLGPRTRFVTQLFARGALDQGMLDGDLILVGGGDPVLARSDLRDAVAAVAAHGIQSVTGTVLVDESFFDR